MKSIIYIFLIFNIYHLIYSAVYTIEEIFQILNNLTETTENLTIILDNLSESLDKVYVYNEINKNPPQPQFDNNYHMKINIQEKLKKIGTKTITPYEFYRRIKLILDNLGDHHLTFGGDIILSYLNFLEPLRLNIKKVDEKYKIFGETIIYTDYLKYFRNYEAIIDIIKNNTNTPIKSINGKDPFDFITNFGGGFKRLKSLQASFRYKFTNLNGKTLTDYPLSYEELTNFTVVYDNGDNFTTDYIIYTTKDLSETEFIKENKFFNFNKKEDEEDENIYYNFKLKNSPLKKSFFIKDDQNNMSENINKFDDIKNTNINNILGSINWDYDSDLSIYCKADNSKKINVYLVNNFNIHEGTRYIKTIKNCVELFDNNDYPIILINNFNQGGLIHDAQLLLELLSPTTTLNIYGAFRNNGVLKNEVFNNEILSLFSNSQNCGVANETIMKTENKINYGNQVEDILSDVVIFNGKKFRKEVESMKKNLKNPRKPTDILVFTDGYTFSAGAIMIKFLQYYGGAITAGYFINPNIGKIPFDSGSCASALFAYNILENLDIEEYKNIDNMNCYLSVPGAQIFYTPNNLNHPLEYEVTPVDEKVYIYPKFENAFNILNEADYDIFIEESLKIFKKYKTECNPNNKKLILLSDECDETFGNNYTHGGYKCGDDGYWTKECVPSYCDMGLIFDHTKKKCIVDICSDLKPTIIPDDEPDSHDSDDSNSKSNSGFNSKNMIIIIVLIVIIISVIIVIIYFIYKRKNLKKEVNTIDNINLDEQML